MKFKHLIRLIIISDICFVMPNCMAEQKKSKFMEAHEFTVSEKRDLVQTIANNKIESTSETKFAFIIRPVPSTEREHYVVKFIYFVITTKSHTIEEQENKGDKNPFTKSLEAFNNAIFEISLAEGKITLINGYQTFADKIDKIYLQFHDNIKDDPPSNSFTMAYFEKIFQKSLYQLPASVDNTSVTWSQHEEIQLLNEKISFETVAKIARIHKNISEVKSNGQFVKDVSYTPGAEIVMLGEYNGRVEYNHEIGFPREIYNILQLEGDTSKIKPDILMSVTDTYRLKSFPIANTSAAQ